ncbi:MAG TPA: c-type cytochrome [Pelomicrobium sp.]|nr:c-type cytochrome [Pelomicrobium sp.]
MADIHIEEHSSPIKTPQQLVVVMVLSFVVPVLIILGLVQIVTGGINANPRAMTPELVQKRIAPEGRLVVAGTPEAEAEGQAQAMKAAAAPAATQDRSGEQVYKAGCNACHTAGVAGAPKTGDQAAGAPRIGQGFDALVAAVWNGKGSMPAKGGVADASKDEIARAVAYMANKSGASFKAPEAKVAAAPAAAPQERTGKEIVEATCGNCHVTGEGGAPKIGDRAAWSQRVSRGLDAVVTAAIRGHDNMPARGGQADLTDAEFKKAVLYMFQQGGGQAGAAAAPAAPAPAAAPAPEKTAAAADGEAVYNKACVACHATGAAGAPKQGDKAAWAPRIAQGKDALYTAAIKGKGVMPPKGGATSLSDAEVKAAVDFMVAKSK